MKLGAEWFTSKSMDLIVWQNQAEPLSGFQLTYSLSGEDHVLSWTKDKGYSHEKLDDGEGRAMQYKMTPILVPDGTFLKQPVLDAFRQEISGVNIELFEKIAILIDEYDVSV